MAAMGVLGDSGGCGEAGCCRRWMRSWEATNFSLPPVLQGSLLVPECSRNITLDYGSNLSLEREEMPVIVEIRSIEPSVKTFSSALLPVVGNRCWHTGSLQSCRCEVEVSRATISIQELDKVVESVHLG